MRDPERLNDFYDTLKKYHKEYFPDWRFGQLMCNFLGWYSQEYGDPFFPEEDKIIEAFIRYCKEI